MGTLRTSQDKGANTGDETREKGVEGEGANQQTVEELDNSGQHDVGKVSVHKLQLLGSCRRIFVEKSPNNGE